MAVAERNIDTPMSLRDISLYLRREWLRSWGIERRTPKTRNYDAVLQKDPAGDVLLLRNKATGALKHLNNYLPDNTTFRPHGWNYSVADRSVGYAESEPLFKKTADVFGLLHEIGHAHFLADIYVELPPKLEATDAYVLLHQAIGVLSPDAPFDDFRRTFAVVSAIEARGTLLHWESFYEQGGNKPPMWLQDASEVCDSIEERFAWDYALRTAQELETEGFNVLSDFRNEEEIHAYINSCLATYERARLRRLAHESPATYTPLYVRIGLGTET